MNNHILDDLDRKIIESFSRDGRASNRQIALELDVTEGTIRTRIKRLQARRLIHFTAVRSYRFAGSPNLVLMGIHCEQMKVPKISQALVEMPEIGCVIEMLGRYSILAMGLFTSLEEVHEIILERIRLLPGVKHVESSIAVHNIKYHSSIARITSRQIQDAEKNGEDSEERG